MVVHYQFCVIALDQELPSAVENLLQQGKDPVADRGSGSKSSGVSSVRDKTRVVNFRVPHNAAVQIYDYKEKKARYVCVCV